MKLLRVIPLALLSMACCLFGMPQSTKPIGVSAISLLSQREPNVLWDSRTLLKADFDYDAVDDFAVGGRIGANYVVGVAKGPLSNQSKHWILKVFRSRGGSRLPMFSFQGAD